MVVDNFILDEFNPYAVAKKLADKMKKKRLLLNMTQKRLSEKSGVKNYPNLPTQ